MNRMKVEMVTALPGESMAQAVRRNLGDDAIPRFVRNPIDFNLKGGEQKYEVHYLTRKLRETIHEC